MDLVFVDVETTGLDPERHELIEIGAVRVDAHPLEPQDHLSVKVRPERLGDADPRALEVNGYSDDAWRDAVSLPVALGRLAPLLDGALVAGHNVIFDWAFLARGFGRAGLALPAVDYHRLDTASLAWPLFARAEAFAEVIDGLHYCAAELVRLERPRVPRVRRRRVYVCHPYRDAPEINVERVTLICQALTEDGYIPIAPQLYLPAFLVDEATQRDEALALCLELVDLCDEVRVYGARISEGMRLELEHAEARGIPVRFAALGGEA